MAHEAQLAESAFQSTETDIIEQPPVNKVAIVAFILGLLGLVSLLAPSMIAVAILAVIVGFIAVAIGGAASRLAYIGIGLGAFAAVWASVNTHQKNNYMYTEGQKVAEHFLDVLGGGNPFLAYELTQMEMDRQITGTDLEAYYASLTGEDLDVFSEFMHDELNSAVMDAGTDADWQFVKGTGVRRIQNAYEVVLEFENAAEPESPHILVRMQRAVEMLSGDESSTTALWNVLNIRKPGENF